jgi:hypothetical protein
MLLVCAGVIAASAPARVAFADDRQECSDAYQKTQELRDADQIDAGIKEAQVCAREVCA